MPLPTGLFIAFNFCWKLSDYVRALPCLERRNSRSDLVPLFWTTRSAMYSSGRHDKSIDPASSAQPGCTSSWVLQTMYRAITLTLTDYWPEVGSKSRLRSLPDIQHQDVNRHICVVHNSVTMRHLRQSTYLEPPLHPLRFPTLNLERSRSSAQAFPLHVISLPQLLPKPRFPASSASFFQLYPSSQSDSAAYITFS